MGRARSAVLIELARQQQARGLSSEPMICAVQIYIIIQSTPLQLFTPSPAVQAR